MKGILEEFHKKYDVDVEIYNMKEDKESRAKGRTLGMKRNPYLVFFNHKGKKIWDETGMVYKSDILKMFARYSVKIKEK